MGAKSTKPVDQQNQERKQEDIIGNNHHPRLVNAKFVKDKDRVFLQLINSISNKQLFERWKSNVKSYEKYQGIDSLYLPSSMEFKTQGLCGSSGTVKSQYEVLPFIMSEEIDNRREINQPFLEKELWYLVYSLAYTGCLLHSDNVLIGDVRPENIFISQDGDIKLSTLHTFYDQQTNYEKALIMKEITLLSPEELKDLQNGRAQTSHHAPTSQCFSIGLTILSALLLQDFSYLYNKEFNFNENQYQKCMKSLRSSESYTLLLRKVVEGMCKKNTSNRLICQEVVELLHPAEEKILNLEDFSLQEIPTDIKNKIQLNVNNNISKVVNPGYNIGVRNSISKVQTPYNILQSPGQSQMHEIQRGSFGMSPSNVKESASFQVRQSNVVQPLQTSMRIEQPHNSSRQPQSSIVIGNQFPVNSQYIQSPQSRISQSKQSFLNSGIYQESQRRNQSMNGITEQHRHISSYQQEPVQQTTSYYQPASQVSHNFSKVKSPEVSDYGSKIQSYIPNQNPHQYSQPVQNQPILMKDTNNKLAEMGRQTTSIRPPPDHHHQVHHYTYTQTTSAHQNQGQDDELFRSYQDIMKNVDDQLSKSRKMFPDQQ